MDMNSLTIRLIREDWGRILSSLVARTGDYALAEDSLQDAVVSALEVWPDKGVPRSPDAWLLTVAYRKALDRIRRGATIESKADELALWLTQHHDDPEDTELVIPDHRLELMYTCCHPALEEKSRVALTLRALGGLTTEEIARAFLDKPTAMAARLTRAKKKMSAAKIAFKLPEPEDIQLRTDGILRVIYVIFSEGCHASNGEMSRENLVNEAIRLARILCGLLPDHHEAKGLLALMLLSDSRRRARRGADGKFVPLEFQNRETWDHARIQEGVALTKAALQAGATGQYAIEAAISAVHAQASEFAQTDWAQIVALYDLLYRQNPNPVLRLNQAVALSYVRGPEAGLALLSTIDGESKLQSYQPYHACRADLLARLGQREEAAEAYRRAIAISDAPEMADFLEQRLNALEAI